MVFRDRPLRHRVMHGSTSMPALYERFARTPSRTPRTLSCAQWNNPPMDQLRALRVFDRAVAAGSLAGAARALDLAPAVVTRVLAELEAHLGARLLNRSTRRIALTDAGATYLERARRILADLDDADAIAGAATTQPRGSLRVLAPPAFAVHQLAAHLPRFHAAYPQLELEIATPGPVDAADANFDVSIVSVGRQPLQGDFVARRLACSAFVVCAAPAYLDRRGRPQQPEDLLQHDAVLPAVSALRRELTLYRAPADAPDTPTTEVTLPMPRSALTTPHLELIFAAAVAGLGIAGLPSFVAIHALHDGRLERVLPQWRGVELTLFAALPTRRQLPARTRAFVDFLVQTFGGTQRDPWLAPRRSARR
jgi:DNA-binding transcriptional LysR family regulator